MISKFSMQMNQALKNIILAHMDTLKAENACMAKFQVRHGRVSVVGAIDQNNDFLAGFMFKGLKQSLFLLSKILTNQCCSLITQPITQKTKSSI